MTDTFGIKSILLDGRTDANIRKLTNASCVVRILVIKKKKFLKMESCVATNLHYVRLFRQSSCGAGAVQLVAHHRDCAVGGHGLPPGRWRRMILRVRNAEPTQPPSFLQGLHSPQSDTRQSSSSVEK